MKLVGVPNSPYFRRTAISLELLNVPFEVEPLSPFAQTEELSQVNPVIKIPTLICDNGEQIMDSSLILEFAEATLSEKTLWPADPHKKQTDFRLVGLAMAAIEKCIQIVYETRLRPAEKQFQQWSERLQRQLKAAFDALEQAVSENSETLHADQPSQADITAAVSWNFANAAVAQHVSDFSCPALDQLSAQMEALDVFKRYPHPRP